MDHSNHGSTTTDTTAASAHAMMIPYFHFTPGDHLFFKEWIPSSSGAIAGACIGLFLLAIIERWVSGMRGLFDHHWKQRALLLASRYSSSARERPASQSSSTPEKSPSDQAIVEVTAEEGPTPHMPPVVPRLRPRTIPPFVWSHDIPRGALYALQTLLGYLLMLAVMTFRVDFIICIVVGSGVGEVLFGRLGQGSHGH